MCPAALGDTQLPGSPVVLLRASHLAENRNEGRAALVSSEKSGTKAAPLHRLAGEGVGLGMEALEGKAGRAGMGTSSPGCGGEGCLWE